MERHQRVSIVRIDPDLGRRLDDESRGLAERFALARLERVERGSWRPVDIDAAADVLGLLLIDGLVLHEVSIAGRKTAELLGPGDFLRAAEFEEGFEAVPLSSRWQVCEPVRVAVLDARFVAVAGRWPRLLDAIMGRAIRRSGRLAVQLAVTGLIRVDARLLIMLWQLAERWGRVGPVGVRLELPVTHDTLALLVGSRRPSVTTALGRLGRLDMVQRVPGGWLLRGDPTEQLARVEHEGDSIVTRDRALGAVSHQPVTPAPEHRRVHRAAWAGRFSAA